MAREPKGARTLGVLVIVAIVLLLVARFVIHNETSASTTSPSASTSAHPSAIASANSSAVTTAKSGHYVSALVDAKIEALSSGSAAALGVGADGAIVRLKLDEATWHPMTSPSHAALHAVAQQGTEAIAVGDDGTILELDGDSWTTATSGTTRALRAVVYTSYGAVAAGDGGTLLRRFAAHTPWRAEPSGTTTDLLGACAGLRDVWIAGRNGAILGRFGGAWKLQPSLGEAALHAVACDDHAAIAVGEHGAMFERLDDVGWHASPSVTDATLFAVSAPMGTRSWLVVGAHGTVMRISGDTTLEAESVAWDFHAVTEGALGTWLGGERGILERKP